MAGPLNVELEKRAPWLFQDLGFRVTYQEYSAKSFGDSVVILESDALRVRFIRDKSRIHVELASLSEPERWMELGFLWYAMTGSRREPELEGWAWFFRNHFAELAEAVGVAYPRTKQQFEQKQEEGRQAAARYCPPLTLAGRLRSFRATLFGVMLMGPCGWIVAAALASYMLLAR